MSMSGTMRMPSFFFNRKRFKANVNFAPQLIRHVSRAELIADEIVSLFETKGGNFCDGVYVTKGAHMVQCAMLAMQSLHGLPVIIGALLHDIGYLIESPLQTEINGHVHTQTYADIGSAYLKAKGFSEQVCAIAEQQGAARRYLVATDEIYRKGLSAGTLSELEQLGGPMMINEANAFERHPYFVDIVNVCRWKEAAKDPKAPLMSMSLFWKILWDHLYYRVA